MRIGSYAIFPRALDATEPIRASSACFFDTFPTECGFIVGQKSDLSYSASEKLAVPEQAQRKTSPST